MKCPYCIKQCNKCGRLLVANAINFSKKKKGKYGVRAECKECCHQYYKQYKKENSNKIKAKSKKYRKNNKEKINEYQREYREKHKNELNEYLKEYRENNQYKIFNYCSKRRLREETQGNGITKEQWLEMMNFFEWRCAYSGEYLGGKENNDIRSIDHVIPLDKNGENEIWNCVPMKKKYNLNKYTKNWLEWYKKQPYFSEERLNKIYEWIKYAKDKWDKK